MTDYKALCAELVDELHGYASANPHHDSDELVARARAALADERGPTTEELRQLFLDHSGYIDNEPAMFWSDFYASARAVLARWGLLAPQPELEWPTNQDIAALHQAVFASRLYRSPPSTTFEVDFARAMLARWSQS